MRTAPTVIKKSLFTVEMRVMLGINGFISSMLLFLLYGWLLTQHYDEALVKTFVFGAFGTYSLFLIFAVRSLRTSIFRFNPFSNRYLNWSVLFGFALMLASIYLEPLQKLFDTVSLPWSWLLGVIAFGIINILLIELTKLLFNRKDPLSS